ncbi:DUF6876 family protein [Burkholderia vietnamiensis]|uniref:DUF6876 family protein n=1 Tax=Burkholderia vietnamiensis TaxID=60552 RepID=UPI001CF22504|nr:DUF6876 family protein [Burkholderia vietnamiensis]MCA8448873.1 hypothetical protein [Burkholderia vietnamiensis]
MDHGIEQTTNGNNDTAAVPPPPVTHHQADSSTNLSTTKEMYTMNANELRDALMHCTGSEQLHGMGPLFKAVITDGVKLLGDEAQCFWLLTDALAVICQKIPGKNYDDGFMVIELGARQPDGGMDLRITTGRDGDAPIHSQHYDRTSFPLDEGIKLYAVWSQANEARGQEWFLMLPSEY